MTKTEELVRKIHPKATLVGSNWIGETGVTIMMFHIRNGKLEDDSLIISQHDAVFTNEQAAWDSAARKLYPKGWNMTHPDDLRSWDQQYVNVTCFDSGLRHTYTGHLYFIGSNNSVMIGTDEILVELIEKIELADRSISMVVEHIDWQRNHKDLGNVP